MRVVAALGGNALLRRGQPMTAENQRENVRVAARSLAPIAESQQLVITHGNGPQVGLLALQSAAYTEVEPYPLDVLGAESEGMIGYLLEQELGNLLHPDQPFATILTQIGKTRRSIRRISRSARSTPRKRRSAWRPNEAGRSPPTTSTGGGWSPRRCPAGSSRSASSSCWSGRG